MEETNYRLLERVVEVHDRTDGAVQPAGLASAAGCDVATVRDCLASLEECDLVAPVDGGYRPTVTGRELLALDVDDPTWLVVDTGGEC